MNFTHGTRIELSNSLSFPENFILPTKLRSYARRRCAEIRTIEKNGRDDDEDMPVGVVTVGGYVDHAWTTRRQAWNDKAREIKVPASPSC